MRTQRLNREEFLEWLALRADAVRPEKRPSNPPSRTGGFGQYVDLVWLDSSDDQEPLIAVDPDDMKDFFAFVSTYVGTYSPFTAFFRVISKPFANELPRDRRVLPQAISTAFWGAIICDAAVQIGSPPPRVSDISLQAALATPSASAVTALQLGYDLDMMLAIIHRWYSARADLAPVPLRLSADNVMSFWSVAAAAVLPDISSQIDPRARRLIMNMVEGRAPGVELSDFSNVIPGLRLHSHNLVGSREDRVRALEAFVAQLPPERSDDNMDMLIGYFIAQVAEGSLNYLSLAAKASERYPASMLWYGFFAGLSAYSEVYTAGECLGRRIARRITSERGPFGPIHADLSYEELALYQQEGRLGRLRTEQASTIEVELMPGVTGKYRLPRAPRRDEEVAHLTGTVEVARKLAAQLQSVLRDAELKPAQGGFFEERPKAESLPRNTKQSVRKKPYIR